MFGFIRKSKVLKIIENGQAQLKEAHNNIPTKNFGSELVDMTKEEWLESFNKINGGIHALECLKKHFK